MKSKIIYALAGFGILAVSVVLTGFLMRTKPEPAKDLKKENFLFVKTEKVVNKMVYPAVTHRGRISSYETVSLSAEVSGKIMQGDIPLKEGESFEKGDLLVQIYNEDTRAALTSGKSNFLRTLSSILPDLKVDFPDEYKKWKQFFNSINVHEELPELPDINSEKEQVFMASMGVLAEYYSLEQQEIKLDKFKLHAPFDGSFVQVNRQVGAVANMGAVLASIIRTDRLELVVPVPPEDAKWIKPGNSVVLNGSENNEATGEVTRVANFLDENTQSVNVYVKYIPNYRESFKVGEFVDATFEITKKARGITIPREALLDNEMVYVVEDQKLKLQKVQVERRLNDAVVISGLKNGMQVVAESLVDVEEGQIIRTRS